MGSLAGAVITNELEMLLLNLSLLFLPATILNGRLRFHQTFNFDLLGAPPLCIVLLLLIFCDTDHILSELGVRRVLTSLGGALVLRVQTPKLARQTRNLVLYPPTIDASLVYYAACRQNWCSVRCLLIICTKYR